MKPFDEMKNREIAAFNHNRNETEIILIEVRNKLHSENRVTSLGDLKDLERLITGYISLLENLTLTIHEQTHFEENKYFIDRNKEYDRKAIESLKISLQDVRKRIEKRETEKRGQTFVTGYTPQELRELRKSLIDNNFICNSITEDEFVYIFSGKPITGGMKPIKWKLHRGNTALRNFLSLLMPGKTIHKNQVRHCFIDDKDKPIEILKPKKDEYSKHYETLEKIIVSIKR